MRVAKDLLSLFDFAGAPLPAASMPFSAAQTAAPVITSGSAAPTQPLLQPMQPMSQPAATLVTALPALQAPPRPTTFGARPARRAREAQAALGRTDLWQADDLPADEADSALPTGFAPLDAELPGGGWPQGQLVEVLLDAPGQGELSLFLPALAALSAAQRAGVWVLPVPDRASGRAPLSAAQPLPYAPALDAAGIDLGRCLFVQPATTRESWWAFEQSLRASHLGAVIGWLPDALGSDGDFRALRRLHLLAAQHRALVTVLRSTRHASAPSPAALRLQLTQHHGRLQVQVLKRRGRPLLDPVTLQVHPDAWRVQQVAPPAAAEPVEIAAGDAPRLAQREQRWSMKALFSH